MHGFSDQPRLTPGSSTVCQLAAARAEAAVSDFIQSRINFERLPAERYQLQDFRLERMQKLLHRLGDPQHEVPAVHIAGTKGKGSTAAMTASILRAAGNTTGLFTSPHVEHFSERMTVDGRRPESHELESLLDELRPVVEAMDAEGDAWRATFFEVLTAMAWLHFRNRQVDAVVLETGLGGRLDATNICTPVVCVITNISRDHERLLGHTLGEIAGEKAGIIKPGAVVLSGVRTSDPRQVIRDTANRQSTPLYELDDQILIRPLLQPAATVHRRALPLAPRISLQTPWRSHSELQSPLAGNHQADNLALAVAAVDFLDCNGWEIPPSAIAEGLEQVEWPLRMEALGHNPLVLVDAAHNVAAIEGLVDSLEPLHFRNRVLIFSTARDKDTEGMLSRVGRAFDRVILTQFVNNPRATARTRMEQVAAETLGVPWQWAEDPSAAWDLAREIATPDSLICATGSFFLAAEFRRLVRPDLPPSGSGVHSVEAAAALPF
jgi:dihydrofolate synthase / folylpolyglutamate synthase